MAAALPSYDIGDMLAALMEIISKYEDKDPDNPPNEGDYLLACNTLKALNDRKSNFTSIQRQIVVTVRERIRRVPVLSEMTFRHAEWMLKKQMEYMSCDVCGSQLKNEYALTRHKKRQTCREMVARKFFFSERFQKRLAKWKAKGVILDFPFIAAMFELHRSATPRLVVLPEPARDITWNSNMVPRRFLPRMLWESMWCNEAQSVNPKFCFKYETDMFCYTLHRDGPHGYAQLFRHSVITQAERIYIQKLPEQLRTALSLSRGNLSTHHPRTVESWHISAADHQPLLTMTIAPTSQPRFRNIPAILDHVAGANPRTDFYAETSPFRIGVPAEPAAAPVPAVVASPRVSDDEASRPSSSESEED
jgi:hypothetical protein